MGFGAGIGRAHSDVGDHGMGCGGGFGEEGVVADQGDDQVIEVERHTRRTSFAARRPGSVSRIWATVAAEVAMSALPARFAHQFE